MGNMLTKGNKIEFDYPADGRGVLVRRVGVIEAAVIAGTGNPTVTMYDESRQRYRSFNVAKMFNLRQVK